MRLIDADKVGLTRSELIQSAGSYKIALEMLLDKIDNAPTIEARLKGLWVGDTDYESWQGYYEAYKCSICDYGLHWSDYTKYNFCPNCGADMRGGKNDD